MITVVNKHWHRPTDHDIYIGRGSPLGNQWSHMDGTTAKYKVATRDEAIAKFAEWVEPARTNDPVVATALDVITCAAMEGDVNLVCYCKPANCHGDVIKKLVEARLDVEREYYK